VRFSRLPVAVKITVSFGALLAISVASGYGSFRAIQATGLALNSAVDTTAKKMVLADRLRARVREMRLHAALAEISLINGTIVGQVETKDGRMVCADCHTADKIASNRRAFEEGASGLRRDAEALLRLASTNTEREAIRRLAESLAGWQPLYARYFEAASAHNFARAHETMLTEIYPLVEDIEKHVVALTAEEERAMAASAADAKSRVSQSAWRASEGVLLCLLIGAGGLTIVRRITRVLRLSSDEITRMTRETAEAAAQIAAASEALAETASEQAASLDSTRASSEEIRSIADRNVERVQAASGLTREAGDEFTRAHERLARCVQAMKDIDVSGAEISRVAAIIDGIAFQTNILALNAAIEAARAGDAGAAFGIVADEVRALAQRSAKAAQDTSTMVASAVGKSSEGKQRLAELAEGIEAITRGSAAIGGEVEQIAGASETQTAAVAAISRALAQMELVTQSVSACSEENAAAGEQLSAQTEALRGVAERLRQLVG
jgi:methyl-accepting chemotaxis protein